MSVIHPIILSGGAGSRLWPLSRSLFPKQLLALTSERSLIQETAARAAGPGFGPPLIVCNVEHRFLIAEQMREAGIHTCTILAELERLEPELLAQCRAAIQAGKQDLDFFRLDQPSFAKARGVSIDYAVMERTDKAAIVPVQMGWSDIGSWDSLWAATERDGAGNAMKGDVLHYGARNSYLRSEGPLVAAVGVEDIVVVATPDAVLVSQQSASQDVKQIVEQ